MLIFRLTDGNGLITYFLCGDVGKVMVRSYDDDRNTTTPMTRQQVWDHWQAHLEKGYTPAKICKSA